MKHFRRCGGRRLTEIAGLSSGLPPDDVVAGISRASSPPTNSKMRLSRGQAFRLVDFVIIDGTIPAKEKSATGDGPSQERLESQFRLVHVGGLETPGEALDWGKADGDGRSRSDSQFPQIPTAKRRPAISIPSRFSGGGGSAESDAEYDSRCRELNGLGTRRKDLYSRRSTRRMTVKVSLFDLLSGERTRGERGREGGDGLTVLRWLLLLPQCAVPVYAEEERQRRPVSSGDEEHNEQASKDHEGQTECG